uniref:Putative DNA-packaging protein n=1 Tax=Anthurium amnicola TaxID=1678845 RepID=A0A1D1YHR1_9ARAE
MATEFNSGDDCFPDMVLPQSSDELAEEMKSAASLSLERGVDNGDYVEIKDNSGFGCLNDFEDNSVYAESLSYLEEAELDVDVVGCSDDKSERVHGDDPDATEYSSSFGNTFSGSDEGIKNEISDAEVDSQFSGQNGASVAWHEFSRLLRKKKLTPHWEKYVRPLRWRCNWLELRMKELHSQAMKYEKELLAYNQKKLLLLGTLASAKSVARTVPFTRKRGKYVMKRRTRKRIEDRVDVSSHMSCHNVFSYYEKGLEVDGFSVDDGLGDNVVPVDQNVKGHGVPSANHDWPMLDFRDRDNSLEHLLLVIETLQSRVVKLRTHLNKTVDRKAARGLASSIAQRDLVSSCGQSLSHSPGLNGDAPPVGAPNTPPNDLSECETEDMVMSESAVSSFGDAAPNIIESTIVDNILINNQAAKEELQNYEKVSRSLEKLQDTVKEEEGSTAPRVSGSETGSETERTVPGERVLKRCSGTVTYVRRSKRPRAERRLSPSSWHCEKIGKRRYSKSKEHS